MKNINILSISIMLLSYNIMYAQPDFGLSEGIYRIPYADGTEVHVTNDHLDHSPQGRIDMSGTGFWPGAFEIVAAADGWVRAIVDDNPLDADDCDHNNYVWIEHLNGEWTKYSHMETNSTSDDAGLDEDDFVVAGQFLGYENSVGCATGDHLHFEVAVSLNGGDLEFNPVGGHITGGLAVNLIPVFCDISLNYFVSGSEYTADDCDGDCTGIILWTSFTKSFDQIEVSIASTSITGSTAVSFLNGSNGLWQAESLISLQPGFTASSGCEFIARIEDCDESPGRLGAGSGQDITIDAFANAGSILVMPNPNAGMFKIEYNLQEESNVMIAIRNSVGQVVFTSAQLNGITTLNETIDLTNHPKGIYIIELHHDTGIKTQQFVIQ